MNIMSYAPLVNCYIFFNYVHTMHYEVYILIPHVKNGKFVCEKQENHENHHLLPCIRCYVLSHCDNTTFSDAKWQTQEEYEFKVLTLQKCGIRVIALQCYAKTPYLICGFAIKKILRTSDFFCVTLFQWNSSFKLSKTLHSIHTIRYRNRTMNKKSGMTAIV